MSRTEVHYCNQCHEPITHRIEETAHYTIRTCEKCQGRTTLKQLNWTIDTMLEPKEWERPK